MSDTETAPAPNAKRPKKTPEQIDFAYVLTDLLLRPTRRRLTFLYPALCRPEEQVLILGVSPDDLIFGNPSEAIAIVKIKDQKRFTLLWDWLMTVADMNVVSLDVIDIGKLSSLVNKAKGDYESVVVEDPDSLKKLVYSLFTLNRLAKTVETYRIAMTDVPSLSYELPIIKDVPTIDPVSIPSEVVKTSPLWEHFKSSLRLVLVRGFDLLCATHLNVVPTFFGLKIWHISGTTVRYAAVIESDEFTFVSARSNVFMIPLIPEP